MKNLFKKSGYLSLLSSILFLILGILLIINPEEIVEFISYIIGAIFIVMGIFKITSYFTSKDKYAFYDYNLIFGAFCCIVGIIIMAFGSTIVAMFRIVIGIWIILSGLNRLDLSMKIKNSGVNSWTLSLLISILIIIAGIYVVFASGSILSTVGIALVVYSIMDIIENIIFMINMNKFFKE